MSWLFSRALVEEFLQETSSDGEQYAPLKVTDMPPAFLLADKTKGIWSPFRFGMTYVHLTEDLGKELLMSFLEAFHARTSPLQGEERVSKEPNQGSGWKWPESSMRYDPNTSSWKTRQSLLLGGLEEFSGTWPQWGTMQNGESWERTPWEPPIKETEFGSSAKTNDPKTFKYPTPTASDLKHKKKKYNQGGRSLSHEVGGSLNPEFVEWLMGWPVGWTGSEPLETDKFQSWLQQFLKH